MLVETRHPQGVPNRPLQSYRPALIGSIISNRSVHPLPADSWSSLPDWYDCRRIGFLGAQGSFQRWASIDGCSTATTTDGDCTYYQTCSAGVEVGLCVKQGGGHAPGDANVGWAFLSRFTLP